MSIKLNLPTPKAETAEDCDGLKGHRQVKESDVGMPTNTMPIYKTGTTEEEKCQWGFTFDFKLIAHICTQQAEEQGSVMDFKYSSACPGPHNPVQAMIMYIWFGAGSVPWIGQGKYVLTKSLFLFSGVIITHQLDVMYVLLLSVITVTDPI